MASWTASWTVFWTLGLSNSGLALWTACELYSRSPVFSVDSALFQCETLSEHIQTVCGGVQKQHLVSFSSVSAAVQSSLYEILDIVWQLWQESSMTAINDCLNVRKDEFKQGFLQWGRVKLCECRDFSQLRMNPPHQKALVLYRW